MFSEKPKTENAVTKTLHWEESLDRNLHFGFSLPKDLQVRQLPRKESNDLFSDLAIFGCSNGRINVQVADVHREINPIELLELTLSAKGHSIEYSEVAKQSEGLVGELASRTKEEQKVYYSRVVKDGPRVFHVSCSLPESTIGMEKADSFAILRSFRLLHPGRSCFAEPLVRHSLTAGLSVWLPFSWDRQAGKQLDGYERFDYSTTIENQPTGKITIEIAEHEEASQPTVWFDGRKRMLIEAGFSVGGAALTSSTVDVSSADFEEWLYDPPVLKGGNRYFAPTWIGIDKNRTMVVSLMSPGIEASGFWWAVNKRAFELVRDTLRVGESALEETPEPLTEKPIEIIEKPMFPNAGTMPSRV